MPVKFDCHSRIWTAVILFVSVTYAVYLQFHRFSKCEGDGLVDLETASRHQEWYQQPEKALYGEEEEAHSTELLCSTPVHDGS